MSIKSIAIALKLIKPVVDDIMEKIPAPRVSEEMIRRDNYFHNCWVKLKFERPDLCIEMQKVELDISGYDPLGKEEEPKKELDENGDEIKPLPRTIL